MDDPAGSHISPWPWLIAFAMLLLAALFALIETAVASCPRTRLKTAQEKGNPKADGALYVLDHFDKAISTLLICTNIVHIAAASLVTVAVTRLWGLSAVTLSTLLTTVVVFFAGEMLPKSVAKKYSLTLTLATQGILRFLMKLFSPLSALLSAIGNFAAKRGGSEGEASVTEDELYDIIEDMEEEGSLDEEQSDLISSALQFGDVEAESVLTPRVDVTAIDIKDQPGEILSLIKKCNHSRLPVYEGSIDNIIGILQIRKFIKTYLREGDGLNLRTLLDQPFFTHPSAKIHELLPQMSRGKQNLAIVLDYHGGTLGILTIEDILEKLVGEIWDEDDVVQEPIVEVSPTQCLVDADVSVSDVFDTLEWEDPEEDDELINTLMGEWAYTFFTAIPVPGDSFQYHDLLVRVEEMDHNRIRKLRVTLNSTAETGEGGEER